MSCILALDQGTTSSRAILFDASGQILAAAQKEFPQHFPASGWVEHNPQEIWSSQLSVAQEAIQRAGVAGRDIAAIGIANQRETTLVWDRRTGEPVYNAIVWQDRRTADFCDDLKRGGAADRVQAKTGLVIDAYFSASKLRWILDNVPNARRRAERGELVFGTVDTWLAWNLTGGKLHVTDVTNASRTMFFNIHQLAWDAELLDLFQIPPTVLPEVRPSSMPLATTRADLLGAPIPLAGMAGDQQAALFGQQCFRRGSAKNTYGTGCFMLMNVGAQPATSKHQLLSTPAWQIPGEINYALEGSVFIGGAVVQWLRDGLGIIPSAAAIEPLAACVPDNGGVYLVPAFAGLGAPHWDQYARGTITGLTRGTNRAHVARAALEAIAYQVADVLDVMQIDSDTPIKELRVDGGASANNLLMQFQADILGVPVIRPAVSETTALGAAYLAGLAVGFWKNLADLRTSARVDRVFEPSMPMDKVDYLCARWAEALRRSREWEEHP